MPGKNKKTRKRYIAFKIHASRTITRKEFIAAIRSSVSDRNSWDRIKPWLTTFEDNCGILRCTHIAKDEALLLLSSIDVVGRERIPIKVETIYTSGTIKKAKGKIIKTINQE